MGSFRLARARSSPISAGGCRAAAAGRGVSGPGELEAVAVEQYLDDDEWEAAERKAGRIPSARPLPFGAHSSSQDAAEGSKPGGGRKGWWPKVG